MANVNLKVLAGVLVVLVLFLQYRLWFERGGIRDMLHLKQQLSLQRAENERMKEQNKELLIQVKYAQNSKQAAELRARNELGMVKNGETFYQIVEKQGN